MLGVGVIGYGYWGPNLLRVFQECEGSQVVAVCDRDAARLSRVTRSNPTLHCCLDARDLVAEKGVKLVVVATPLDTHFELAKLAIEGGKHVLVEKPMTRTAGQAEELIELAKRAGVLLAVDHTFVFTPAVEKMKELIDKDHLGRINYVDSVRINLGLIQDESDVIWDLAPHDFSILDYLLGKTPLRVVATGASHTSGGQVDVAYINLDYGGGLIANIHVNWLSPVKIRRMILGGDRRMIIFDDLSSNEKVRVFDSGAAPVLDKTDGNGRTAMRVDYRIGDIWTPHLFPQEALALQAEHLVDAIVRGAPLRADGQAGLRVVQLLEACGRSLNCHGDRRAIECHVSGPSAKSRLDWGKGLPVPLSRPQLGEPEIAAVTETLRSGWITQGPVTAQFESDLARRVGARYGVAVSNGTAALYLALQVLGIEPGDEVIVPSLTFIATANVVRCCGAKPVFADVNFETFNLDPASVEQVVTGRTRALLAVHQFGLPADLDPLHALARKYGFVVVEDAACALGSTYKGRRIGTHSALVGFSFHPRKIVTTGEGGMIVTDSDKLAEKLRRLRHHGMDCTDWQRHLQPFPRREAYVELGFNFRMSDLCAAVGLAQLDRVDELVETRRGLVHTYNSAFRGHPFLEFSVCPYEAQGNGQTYALVVRNDSPIGRDAMVRHLQSRGIGAKAGLACIHREPCYRADNPDVFLPQSEALAERMFLLPLFPDMTAAQQEQVVDSVLQLFEGRPQSIPLAEIALAAGPGLPVPEWRQRPVPTPAGEGV